MNSRDGNTPNTDDHHVAGPDLLGPIQSIQTLQATKSALRIRYRISIKAGFG